MTSLVDLVIWFLCCILGVFAVGGLFIPRTLNTPPHRQILTKTNKEHQNQ